MSTAAHLDVHLCKHVPRLHSWTYGHPSVYIIADMHIITLATHLLGFVGFIGGGVSRYPLQAPEVDQLRTRCDQRTLVSLFEAAQLVVL